MLKLKLALVLLLPLITLQACAPVLIAGAATTGVSVLHDRRTSGSVIDDQSIEFKAAHEISLNKELYEKSQINVTSYNGIVLLTGEVMTDALKQQATQALQFIPKVQRIHNELIIAAPSALPSRTSDSWITSKVKTKMAATKGIDPFYIKVVTEHGVVYLMGIVSQEEADLATDLVSKTAGVQRIIKIFEYNETFAQ